MNMDEIEMTNSETGETMTMPIVPRDVCVNTLDLYEQRKRFPRTRGFVGGWLAALEDAGNWLFDHPGTPIVMLAILFLLVGTIVGTQLL